MDKKNPLFSKSKLYYAKAENSIRYHRVTNTGGPRQSKRPALHAHLFTKEINVDDLEAIKKKKKKKKKGKKVVERSSANVAAWNAYDNEPSRLPDGASEQGDDVEPIETSRPDTRKVEGEEADNRHRGKLCNRLSVPGRPSTTLSGPLHTRERKSRSSTAYTCAKGYLPPASHLKLRIEQRPGHFQAHLTRGRARLSEIIGRSIRALPSCKRMYVLSWMREGHRYR